MIFKNIFSAYCGSLWLAALCVSVKMAKKMDEQKLASDYRSILEKSKKALALLKNEFLKGNYFRYFKRNCGMASILILTNGQSQ